jgi:hypothetical protein
MGMISPPKQRVDDFVSVDYQLSRLKKTRRALGHLLNFQRDPNCTPALSTAISAAVNVQNSGVQTVMDDMSKAEIFDSIKTLARLTV